MTADTVADLFQAVGMTLKDSFRIERVVAEGGFGLVYKATHITLDRPVAIKVLKTPTEFNEEARREFVTRFKDEARTVVRVKHPAVVQVIDFGASRFPNGEEAAWTAMEWIEGATLEEELHARRNHGGRHPVDALALMRPVLEAVAIAHDEHIAHRDLKPANIMIVRGRRGATVRLLDFGIAKLMEPGETAGSGGTHTSASRAAYSPRYAAPEQLSRARTGPWSDVHALAMILSEILTDQLGYAGKDPTAIFVDAMWTVRPTPAKFSIDVGAWEPVLACALALQPHDRFSNAGALLAALDAALPAAKHPHAPEHDAVLGSSAPSEPTERDVAARSTTLQTDTWHTQASPDAAPARFSAGSAKTSPAAPQPMSAAPSPPIAPVAEPPRRSTLRRVVSMTLKLIGGLSAIILALLAGLVYLTWDDEETSTAPASAHPPAATQPAAPAVAPAAPSPAAPAVAPPAAVVVPQAAPVVAPDAT